MKSIFRNRKMRIFSLGLLLAGIVSYGFLMQSCRNEIDIYDDTDLSNVSIDPEAEEFGRQMADNLRYVVTCMNKNGDDFSDLAKIKAAILKYYPQHDPVQSLNIEGFENAGRKKYHYTPVQLTFLEKIKDAQVKSRTANEFMLSLKKIIKEIQATVPEIQQRNLLKSTVALYYLTKETDLLLKEGLIPVNLKHPQHIRLRSDAEGFWASLWAGACVATDVVGAELLATLEGMAFAAGVAITIVGACLLLTGDTDNILSVDECIDFYADHCISGPCGDCLHYCRVQGKIDSRCTYN
jgi:hypothetical protein